MYNWIDESEFFKSKKLKWLKNVGSIEVTRNLVLKIYKCAKIIRDFRILKF